MYNRLYWLIGWIHTCEALTYYDYCDDLEETMQKILISIKLDIGDSWGKWKTLILLGN